MTNSGLAASGFTHEPKGFAFPDRKADIINSLDLINNLTQDPSKHGIVLHQVFDDDHISWLLFFCSALLFNHA
jgi:hypothetical protein